MFSLSYFWIKVYFYNLICWYSFCSCIALNQTISCEHRKHYTSFSLFGSLGAKENPTLFGWSPFIQYCTCFVWVSLCGVLVFLSLRPHCMGADLSGPLFVFNVRLSLSSSPGARSGGSGSVVLRADLESVHAISSRCAPHSGVGTHCCIKCCGLCLLVKHTPQVCIKENREGRWVCCLNELCELPVPGSNKKCRRIRVNQTSEMIDLLFCIRVGQNP